MFDLSGRVALVTGAGPNIGGAIAATWARAEATVLCNDLRADIAEAAAKAAAEGGHKAFPLAFDITGIDIRVDGGTLATWGTRSQVDPTTIPSRA